MDLPILDLDSVVHIGSFGPSDKDSRGSSYEGHGLSVSRDPDEWEALSKFGGSGAPPARAGQ